MVPCAWSDVFIQLLLLLSEPCTVYWDDVMLGLEQLEHGKVGVVVQRLVVTVVM